MLARSNHDAIDVTVFENESTDEVADFANSNEAVLCSPFKNSSRLTVCTCTTGRVIDHIRGRASNWPARSPLHSRGPRIVRASRLRAWRCRCCAKHAMTTLRIEHGIMADGVLGELATVISRTIGEVIHR